MKNALATLGAAQRAATHQILGQAIIGRSVSSMGMDVGAPDGFGRFAVVDEQTGGLLCHECGRRFAHLGLHVYKAHEISANEYRTAHGLGRRGLVATATRDIIANKRPGSPGQQDPLPRSARSRRSQGGRARVRSAHLSRRARGHPR